MLVEVLWKRGELRIEEQLAAGERRTEIRSAVLFRKQPHREGRVAADPVESYHAAAAEISQE